MNETNTTFIFVSNSSFVTNPSTASTEDTASILSIVGGFLLTAVSILGMAIFSLFFKRYCGCCCFLRANHHSIDDHDHEYDRDQDIEHIEEGARREEQYDDDNYQDNGTASTIPSIINISSRCNSTDRRWGRRSIEQAIRSHSLSNSKQLPGSAVPLSNGRQSFPRRGGNNNSRNNNSRNSDRQRRRRHRRDRLFFRAPHSPTSSSGTGPNDTDFFDHTTILTSSCDDMSLPDAGCESMIDDAANAEGAAENTNRNETNNRHSIDPPGTVLGGEETVESVEDIEAYPSATIQFRNPINGNNSEYGRFSHEEEIDLLIDFLVHIEDYVRYPRSKLTIILRARVPVSEDDREELQHLRAIVEDSSSSSPPPPAGSPPSSGNESCTEQNRERPPLQVFITTTTSGGNSVSSEEDLLRCAPIGGILVTFGSVWELPEGHPDFLKDLVV